MNKKEYALAIKSAVASTGNTAAVMDRGHKFDDKTQFPIVLDKKALDITKTSDLIKVIENLGLGPDLERTAEKKVRAGKHKRRGRKYRRKIGPLIVVADDCNLLKSGNNISGVEVCKVKDLDVEILAPGSSAGRATIWTEDALDVLANWR